MKWFADGLSFYPLHRGQCAHSNPEPHLATPIVIPGSYNPIQRQSTLISGDKRHTQSPHPHSWPVPGKTYPWKVPVLTPGFSRCSIKVVNRISSLEHKGILRFSSEQIQKSQGNKHPVKITISPRTMQVKGQSSLMGLLRVLYKGGFGNSSLERSCMKAIIYLSRLLQATESLAAAG